MPSPNQASNLSVRDALLALSDGDYSVRCAPPSDGSSEITDAINSLAEQLETFTSEMTRLAREIGTNGMFGGQAEVPDARGSLAALVSDLNRMSENVTVNLRLIYKFAGSPASGRAQRPLPDALSGEWVHLRDSVKNLAGSQPQAGN